MVTLDLHKYGSPDVGVFCCRDRAHFIREAAGIKKGGSVRLIVPDYVFSLTGTFMCGLLCDQEHVEVDEGNPYWKAQVAEYLADHKTRRLHDGLPWRPACRS